MVPETYFRPPKHLHIFLLLSCQWFWLQFWRLFLIWQGRLVLRLICITFIFMSWGQKFWCFRDLPAIRMTIWMRMFECSGEGPVFNKQHGKCGKHRCPAPPSRMLQMGTLRPDGSRETPRSPGELGTAVLVSTPATPPFGGHLPWLHIGDSKSLMTSSFFSPSQEQGNPVQKSEK